MADRQVALAAGGLEVNLSSEGPGRLKLDKIAIGVEEMEKLLGIRQGQLVVGFANVNGEEIAKVDSSEWTLTIKARTMRMVLELRLRPEAETLLILREIQQQIESEDLEAALVVMRPLQAAELEQESNTAAGEGDTAGAVTKKFVSLAEAEGLSVEAGTAPASEE